MKRLLPLLLLVGCGGQVDWPPVILHECDEAGDSDKASDVNDGGCQVRCEDGGACWCVEPPTVSDASTADVKDSCQGDGGFHVINGDCGYTLDFSNCPESHEAGTCILPKFGYNILCDAAWEGNFYAVGCWSVTSEHLDDAGAYTNLVCTGWYAPNCQ